MDDMLKVLVFVLSLTGAGVFAFAAISSVIVRNRRLLGNATAGQDQVDELHARLAATEALEGRIEELEQRLDFAERMLAEHRETERLPAGPPPDHR